MILNSTYLIPVLIELRWMIGTLSVNSMMVFNMDSSITRIIPLDPNGRLSKQMAPTTEEEKEEMQQVPYREAVGSLMYVTTTFRPDIAYAVSQVAQFCENPGRPHWTAVKRIMAYLKGTLNHGIVFGKKEEEEALQLYGYTDADYAGDLDHRRSTTGYIYKLNGGPVAWCSRRQQCTAMSTTEAEYVAASETAKEATWLRRILNDVGTPQINPTLIKCDNQSAISLITNRFVPQQDKAHQCQVPFREKPGGAGRDTSVLHAHGHPTG